MDHTSKYPFVLPELPYEMSALEPYISANTMSFHYGKHHQGYVNKANDMLKGSDFEKDTMLDIMKKTYGKEPGIFNNVAQIWNHDFFWKSMKPKGTKPSGDILEKIAESFGTIEKFAAEFAAAGAGQFGSGWAWLVEDGGKLKVTKTPNAENPLVHGQIPLLTIDVWEHAYYLDYQNKRPDFIKAFLDHLINWEFAEANLKTQVVYA